MAAKFSVQEIIYSAHGRLICGNGEDTAKGRLIWDVDKVEPGDWFVAIAGDSRDGHDALEKAFRLGASGAIVNRRTDYRIGDFTPTIVAVADTKVALHELARYWRYAVGCQSVGVTGVAGRRSVMVLMSQLLAESRKTHVAFVSALNWSGCLEQVFQMPEDTDILLFEAASIDRGDIARIGSSLEPDLAVITPVKHPLPTRARSELLAAQYCEILEVVTRRDDRISAVVCDVDASVTSRCAEVIDRDAMVLHSRQRGKSLVSLSEDQLSRLSRVVSGAVGQSVSGYEVWCAVEACRHLGLDDKFITEMFADSVDGVHVPPV